MRPEEEGGSRKLGLGVTSMLINTAKRFEFFLSRYYLGK